MFSFTPTTIDKLLQKDKSAFDAFYIHMVDIFYRYIKSHFAINDGDCHDLIADVFVKIWGSLDKYDKKYNFESYIRTILKNTIKDYFKKSKSISFSSYDEKRELSMEDILIGDDDVLEEFQKNYLFEDIDRVMKTLDQVSQDLLHFRFVEQRSYEEIELITNISTQNLRKKLSRAVANLRKRLQNNQKV